MRVLVALAVAIVAGPGEFRAQQPAFRAGTELVTIPATVTLDGKYRRLKVIATNQEIAVRHRGGYLARPR